MCKRVCDRGRGVSGHDNSRPKRSQVRRARALLLRREGERERERESERKRDLPQPTAHPSGNASNELVGKGERQHGEDNVEHIQRARFEGCGLVCDRRAPRWCVRVVVVVVGSAQADIARSAPAHQRS